MNHLFVPYHIALLAKEKGFDEKCLKLFNPRKYLVSTIDEGTSNSDAKIALPASSIAAPLYQQLVDWFREKHNIWIMEGIILGLSIPDTIGWHIYKKKKNFFLQSVEKDRIKAFEEAFKLI